tara:strand:+ start:86 stop:256 length:171 start_codon:yes stop_codon:yes gene_type:complete
VGFKDYKIRDGVHIPTKEYKQGWNAIFGKKKNSKEFKPKGENSKKPLVLNKKPIAD